MGDGTEPVNPDEELLRRIQFSHFDPATDPRPSLYAFRPGKRDTTGLSMFRRKYHGPEQIAPQAGSRPYWVGVLRAGDLFDVGLTLVPSPTEQHKGHVEIPELTYVNRRSPEAKRIQLLLAEKLCVMVPGWFDHHLPPQDRA